MKNSFQTGKVSFLEWTALHLRPVKVKSQNSKIKRSMELEHHPPMQDDLSFVSDPGILTFEF